MKLLIILGLVVALGAAEAEKSIGEKKSAVAKKVLRTMGHPKSIDVECTLCIAILKYAQDEADGDLTNAITAVEEECEDWPFLLDLICEEVGVGVLEELIDLVDVIISPERTCEDIDMCD